ncbi:hypothetical protein [Emcibacter sp.]|uniref:hypothetical protein n=1 Tax=Emcibacter sp. TaxID=1979954 RepID=UPI002AA912A1|nr:hypothetical protein [Emcibacter sp.]
MSEENQSNNSIASSLRAVWLLAQFDGRGMEMFDLSAEGFWKSFWAIVVAAPLAVLPALMGSNMAEEAGLQSAFWPSLVSYFIHLPFTAFIMIYFTRYMKIDANYAPMIIAYNWSTVIVYAVSLPLSLIIAGGVIGQEVGVVASMLIAGYIYCYRWFVFKESLQISGWLAIGVLLFQQLAALLVDVVLIRLMVPGYFERLSQAAG